MILHYFNTLLIFCTINMKPMKQTSLGHKNPTTCVVTMSIKYFKIACYRDTVCDDPLHELVGMYSMCHTWNICVGGGAGLFSAPSPSMTSSTSCLACDLAKSS